MYIKQNHKEKFYNLCRIYTGECEYVINITIFKSGTRILRKILQKRGIVQAFWAFDKKMKIIGSI